MKRLIAIFSVLTAVLGASAQAELGTWSVVPHIGASVSTLTPDGIFIGGSSSDNPMSSKYASGFSGGADVVYHMTVGSALSAGVAYSRLGCGYEDAMVMTDANKGTVFHDTYISLDYIEIPIMENIYLAKGFAIKAGVLPRFLIGAKMHSENQDFTIDTDTGARTYGQNDAWETTGTHSLRKFDIAIPLGISYEYQHVVLDARYNVGLTKIYKYGFGSSKNRSFLFTLGYKFDL